MKKTVRLICILFCLFTLFSTPINAEETVYKIPALNMDVTLPQTWLPVTRDAKANDPIFSILNISRKEKLKDMKERNTYLDLYDSTITYKIGITMTVDEGSKKIYDFNNISDYDLQAYMQMEQSAGKSQGINYSKYDEYKNDQAKYMVFEGSTEKTGAHLLQYMTIINGQRINIMALSDNAIPDSVYSAAKQLVQNIHFTKITQKSDTTNSNSTKTQKSEKKDIKKATNTTNAADTMLNLYIGMGSIIFIIILSAAVTFIKYNRKK